jgi:hypothetical protein
LKPVPLTSHHGSEVFPAVSPSGEEIAFSWNGPAEDRAEGNANIYLISLEGGLPWGRRFAGWQMDSLPATGSRHQQHYAGGKLSLRQKCPSEHNSRSRRGAKTQRPKIEDRESRTDSTLRTCDPRSLTPPLCSSLGSHGERSSRRWFFSPGRQKTTFAEARGPVFCPA